MTTKITEQNVSNFANFGIQWQAVVVADGSTALTVSAGKGYFIDTTSATQTVNLPANASSTAGDTIILKDYARKWDTNKVTIASNTFDGVVTSNDFNTQGQTITLVHMGSTKGWSLINEDTTTALGAKYVAATGGTVTTSGSVKIHSFTGDGNFVVSQAGNADGANKLDYLVVAGGGGANDTGGGGAGGFRISAGTETGPYTIGGTGGAALTAAAQTYPVTVGAGGNSGTTQGSTSTFSTISSAGGGGGAHGSGGQPGGSGGGAGYAGGTGGTGNTPPVSPPQGNPGGTSPAPQNSPFRGSGGGGASQAGGNQPGGNGGNGYTNHITGSPVAYAGGGGGAGTAGAGGNGGCGGGGASGSHPSQDGVAGEPGTANRGGGAGSASGLPSRSQGGSGGKGIVIVRYKFQA